MSYNLIVGYTGAGKTFFLVRLVRQWAKQAYKDKEQLNFYSNMSINLDFKHKGQVVHVPVIRYTTLDELVQAPPNTVIIVDEASAYFHARYWKDTPSDFLSMIAQGRKGGIDIIASTQRYKSVDVEFREKCHHTFLVTKYMEIFFVASLVHFDIFTESIIDKSVYDWWTLFNKDRLAYNTMEFIRSGKNETPLFTKVTTALHLNNVKTAENGSDSERATSELSAPQSDLSIEQSDIDKVAGADTLSLVSRADYWTKYRLDREKVAKKMSQFANEREQIV